MGSNMSTAATNSFTWGANTYKYTPAEGYELLFYKCLVYSLPTDMISGMILSPFLMLWFGTYAVWLVAFNQFDTLMGEISAFWYSSLITTLYVYKNGFSELGG